MKRISSLCVGFYLLSFFVLSQAAQPENDAHKQAALEKLAAGITDSAYKSLDPANPVQSAQKLRAALAQNSHTEQSLSDTTFINKVLIALTQDQRYPRDMVPVVIALRTPAAYEWLMKKWATDPMVIDARNPDIIRSLYRSATIDLMSDKLEVAIRGTYDVPNPFGKQLRPEPDKFNEDDSTFLQWLFQNKKLEADDLHITDSTEYGLHLFSAYQYAAIYRHPLAAFFLQHGAQEDAWGNRWSFIKDLASETTVGYPISVQPK